uniref:Uncharacterized protein n=1 Tax=Plectus sambesii TaxID=2011161 RepID=A0A914XPD2_9BILA
MTEAECLRLMNAVSGSLEELKQLSATSQSAVNKLGKRLLAALFNFGIYFEANRKSISDETVLEFLDRNTPIIIDCYRCLSTFVFLFSCDVAVADGLAGEDEAVKICRTRSGLQFLLDYFRPRLCAIDEEEFDYWFQMDAEIPALDDRLLIWREHYLCVSVERTPNVPTSHWWWQRPEK